jgi:hypothetical protein
VVLSVKEVVLQLASTIATAQGLPALIPGQCFRASFVQLSRELKMETDLQMKDWVALLAVVVFGFAVFIVT